MKVFSIGFLAITCLTSLVMASYWPLSSLPTGAVYTGYTMDTVLAGLAAAAGAGLAAYSLFGRGGGNQHYRSLQRSRREAIFKTLEATDQDTDCAKLYLCQRATLMQLKKQDLQIIELVKEDKLNSVFEAALDHGLRNKGRPQACQLRYFKCK